MTLQLCGFSVSNYYNKVKLALLEKGIPFAETQAYPSGSEAFLAESPMGKVPFLKFPRGTLSESQAIIEYLEDAFPQTPLYPHGDFERAKCRELIHLMELYLELPARRLYPAAFFGGTASEELKKEVQTQLTKGMRAFTRLLRFGPYIAGAQFTYADCAALVHLPLVSSTCRTIFGEDLLAPVPGLDGYLSAQEQRPPAQRVNADRKAGLDAFVAYRAKAKAQASANNAASRVD
jgi:glutathione S-transferase